MGSPSTDGLAALADRYLRESTWRAYGYFGFGQVLGLGGLELGEAEAGRLRHLGVRPQSQRAGIALVVIGVLPLEATNPTEADSMTISHPRGRLPP